MSSEKTALYDKAYPELQTFCQSLGYVFEVVDMEWGVLDTISTDHMTTELCLREIEVCKQLSAGPSFIALLGNRYGHRSIPRVIPEKTFEMLLSKVSRDQEGLKLLNQWFFKDNNALPPEYVLQPITNNLTHYKDLRPESKQQREKDISSWRHIESQLLQLLRTAAIQAEKDGDIMTEQKHQFFRSETETEIEEGLRGQDSSTSAIIFVRELPSKHTKEMRPKHLSQYLDVTPDGLLDTEAQDLLAVLKSRLYASLTGIINLHCVELNKGAIDSKHKEHALYLDSMCEQFVCQIKKSVSSETWSSGGLGLEGKRVNGERSRGKVEENWTWVIEDIYCHTALCNAMCARFCGREGLLGKMCLAMWESSNTYHGPFVVHGDVGVGKTAFLCKLVQEMRNVLDPGAVVVFRLIGMGHPPRPDVDYVLHSICIQICTAFSLPQPKPQIADIHQELVLFFHFLLDKVSQQGNTLLLILDSLDQLSEVNHAHKLYWLPKDIPPHVHLVVSTTNQNSLDLLKMNEAIFFEVEPLLFTEAEEIMDTYMRALQRTLTPEQREAVLCSFEKCGRPLQLMLILEVAKQWPSYKPLTEQNLYSNPQEVMSHVFLGLEERHGKQLVGATLGYIISARNGLSEAELQDILSLDDNVLDELYQHFLPLNNKVIRLPFLLWARLRHDLGDLIVERQAHGMKILRFQHRQVTEMVRERYLSAELQLQRHKILAENFLGHWSQGKLKPLMLSSTKVPVVSDRKVSPQPLWLAKGVANIRKLQELPYHLIHAGLWDELRQEVIGSTEWLYCKTLACGVTSVIQDLSLCSDLMNCTETELIRDTLILMKPTLDFLDGHIDPSLFYIELNARLHSLTELHPSLIGRLCSQCQAWLTTCPDPTLAPQCSFFQSPGGPLKATLAGFQRGVTALDICLETGVLVAGSEDGKMIIWDLNELEVIQTLVSHTAAILCVKLIKKGTQCVSLASDGTLGRWSVLSGRQIFCVKEAAPNKPLPTIPHILLSEEKELVFVQTRDQMKAWHLDSGEPAFNVINPKSVILGVLNGTVVSLSDEGLVTFICPSTGTKMVETNLGYSAPSINLNCTLTMPQCDRLLIVSKDGFLYQVSSTGRQSVTEFSVNVSFLSLAEDERTLFAGCDKTLNMFNIEMDSIEKFFGLQHEDTVLCAQSSRNSRVVLTGSEDQIIRVWSITTGILLDSLHGMEGPINTLILFEGTAISASNGTDYLRLWQLQYNRKHKPRACIPAGCPHLTLTKDGDTVFYVKSKGQKEVLAWNCHTGSLTDTMATSAEVCCLELAQDKRLLFCGLNTGTILIYPLAFPHETLCIPPLETVPRVCCLAVSSQEKHLAVAYDDSVCLFEITDRDSFPSVEGPFERFPLSLLLLSFSVSAMTLLPDKRLLYGTDSGEVTIYDFKSATAMSLDGHHGRVTCITASNWGTHALVGSEDAVQRLWGLNPVVLDHTMEYKGFFFEGVLCATFSKCDQYVFTGTQDRTINIWDVASGNLLYVQYVYAPIIKLLSHRSGFVAISQLGDIIKAGFHCPYKIRPEYNPLRNIKAQYRVTSREKNLENRDIVISKVPGYNPAQFDFMGMLKSKTSSTCQLL
ncbi:NACHT domain- and WD repeat-containing protein 1 [Osmerus eperlanus]|uniref:NACHT domain- and WD repeat-containing protein 1 n=1 Tax=Osmerus eperlanus TaxID=29151 RepID=UPI002E12D27A